MTQEILNCFYRVSIKALVLNSTKDRFLVCKESNGKWELPGGGLDWGLTPQEDLPREIMEEMGLEVTHVADKPSYFFTFKFENYPGHAAIAVYEASLKSLDFTPSDECTEIAFVNKNDLAGMEVFAGVKKLCEEFDN